LVFCELEELLSVEVNLNMSEISRIAYYLALIGGILLVIFGLLSLVGMAFTFIGPFISFGFAYFGIVMLICGIIAIIGARSAATIVWAIVLIIVGIIGGGLGGLLVILGGIIGLIAVLIRKT
jgi:hypothetical protein